MSQETPHLQGSDGPRSAFSRWAPFGTALLVLLLGLVIWEPFPPGIWHDDGVYVMLGRSLARGEGLRYLGVQGAPLAPKFPPVYPLLLAGVWRVFPSFPENVPLLSGVNLLLLAAAAGIFVAYVRDVVGLGGRWAVTAAILAWASPELWRLGLVPLSEPSFLFFLLLALWAAGRAEVSPGWRPVLVFLLAAGVAIHARTLGLAVFLGASVAMAARSRRRAGLGILAGLVAVSLPWLLWTTKAAETIPAPLRDTLGPYGSWWIHQVSAEPVLFLRFLVGNARALSLELLALVLPGVHGGLRWLGVLLVAPLVFGVREIARRTLTLPLTVAFSLGILWAWPFQDIRLVAPFGPFVILACLVGFRELLRAGAESRRWSQPLLVRAGARTVLTAGAGGWVALLLVVSGARLVTGWPAEPYRTRSEALVKAVEAVNGKTPTDAVVGAPELWSGIHLFTGRTVVPSARFLPLAPGVPTWGTPREQYELWRATGVTHLLVEHGGKVHGEALDRVDALCPGTVQVLDLQPGQFLVALPWDVACQERVMAPDGPRAIDGTGG